MPHQLAGVDISASGIKIARFDVSFRGLNLSRLDTISWIEPEASAPAAEDQEDTKVDTTPGVPLTRTQLTLRMAKLAHTEAYFGFPSQLASSRQLTFPLTDVKKIEPMIGFELEDQLPRALEDTVFDSAVTRVSRVDTELLVASADKKQVAALIGECTGGDVQPRAMYYEPLAYTALAPGLSDALIVDVGAERTLILQISQGRVLQARSLRFGGNRVDAVLAEDLKISVADAKRGKEQVGNIFPDGPQNDASDRATKSLVRAVSPLVMALKQMLHARHEDAQPGIFLTGGQSLLRGLPAYLAKTLDCECAMLPLPPVLAAHPEAHRYALGYALAVSSAAPRQPKIDFRRGEFSFRSDLSQFRAQGQRYIWAAAAVVMLAFLSGVIRYSLLKSDDAALDKTLREVTKKITGHEMSDYKIALVALRQSSSPDKSAVPQKSALDFFAALSKRIGPDLDLHATEIDIREDKISLKGEATNFEAIDKIVDAIKADDCFKQTTLGNSHKTTDGTKVEFQVSIDVGSTAGCGT